MNSFWNEELSRLLFVKEMQLLKQQAYCPRKPVRVFDQGRLLNEKLVALEHSSYIRKPMVRDLNKPTKPIFNFKKEDVNIVLYGYIRNEESSGALLHSLSGIMSSKLQSEGKNFFFILSGWYFMCNGWFKRLLFHYKTLCTCKHNKNDMFSIQIMFLLRH